MTVRSRYRIIVRGNLSERFDSAFEGMTLVPGKNETALVGEITDQAQLRGVLERMWAFGLELLSVSVVAEGAPCREDEGQPDEADADSVADFRADHTV